ncbi:MAG: alpha/beta hydrolase, partial [Clostridia bacterium]|nr:alpha/beta hydrolase [Clostridia bacterium]
MTDPANVSTPPQYSGMRLKELVFATLEDYDGKESEYRLDIISPCKQYDTPRPAILFIHGGGFVDCDKRQGYIPVFAKHLTGAGYTVVSPDYPMFSSASQRNSYPPQHIALKAAEAAHKAYLYITENADTLNIDKDRIAIMGGSAGGMTAFYLLEHYSDNIRLFINFWGAPWHYSPDVKGFPPTLSIHGTADPTVSYELELPISDAFEKHGIPHKLI